VTALAALCALVVLSHGSPTAADTAALPAGVVTPRNIALQHEADTTARPSASSTSVVQPARNTPASQDDWRFHYLLSAIAQALASIMTLVFTVTLVVTQLTSTYGMHLAEAAFGRRNLAKMGVFVFTMMFSLVALYRPSWVTGALSLALTLGCMAVLLLHFRSMRAELDILTLVRGTRDAAVKHITAKDTERSMREIDKLETVAYRATGQCDYATTEACVRTMSALIGHLLSAEPDDAALDVKERIKQMALDVRGRPKAVSVVLQGFVDGLAMDAKAVRRFYPQVVETLEALLHACEWPREEESVAAVFLAAGRFLDRLRSLPGEWTVAAVYVMRRMTDEWRLLVEPVRNAPLVPGRGRAATTLHAAYASLAQKCARQSEPDVALVNAAVKYTLDLLTTKHTQAGFGASKDYVLERTTATLVATAGCLNVDVIKPVLERVMHIGDSEPEALRLWWDVVQAMLGAEKSPLVASTMKRLVTALKTSSDPEREQHRRSVLTAVAGDAGRLAGQLHSEEIETVSNLLSAAGDKRISQHLALEDMVQLIKAFAATPQCTSGENELVGTLWRESERLVNEPINRDASGAQIYNVDSATAFCWLLSAALYLKRQAKPPRTHDEVLNILMASTRTVGAKLDALRKSSAEVWRDAQTDFADAMLELASVYKHLGFQPPAG
jgi:hypothetical protein